MWNWFKKFWNTITTVQGIYALLTSEFVKLTLLPLLFGGVAAALGFIDGVPLMYIWVGTLIAVAMLVTILLRRDEWQERIRVDGKLVISGPAISADVTDDGSGLAVVQIGVALENRANFPISYRVTTIRSSADHTNPSRGIMDNFGSIVPPKTSAVFKDRPIDLKIPKKDMPATLSVALTYGRPGKEKYSLSKDVNIRLLYNSISGVVNFPWSESTIKN